MSPLYWTTGKGVHITTEGGSFLKQTRAFPQTPAVSLSPII